MAVVTPEPTALSDTQFAKQISEIVRDLIAPKAWIYWTDALLTAGIGWSALAGYLVAPPASLWQAGCFLVAGFALYRGLMFIHELAHLPKAKFRAFYAVWNVLFGVPLMTPAFLYAEHRTHHVNHSYGTHGDAEYIPIGRGPVLLVLAFLLQGLLMPLLAVVRFLILAPLSCCLPPLRTWVWERASGLTQNNQHFRRPAVKGWEKIAFAIQEAGCFTVCATVVTLVAIGVVPGVILLKLYALFAFVTTVSYARALGSHLYWNEGEPMSYIEQMLDSTTIPGNYFLTELWAPLGQRYHALHHLIPSLPYHALGPAHRRLLQQLPADSPYRKTIRSSLVATLWEIFTRAAAETRQRGANV